MLLRGSCLSRLQADALGSGYSGRGERCLAFEIGSVTIRYGTVGYGPVRSFLFLAPGSDLFRGSRLGCCARDPRNQTERSQYSQCADKAISVPMGPAVAVVNGARYKAEGKISGMIELCGAARRSTRIGNAVCRANNTNSEVQCQCHFTAAANGCWDLFRSARRLLLFLSPRMIMMMTISHCIGTTQDRHRTRATASYYSDSNSNSNSEGNRP